MYTNSRLVGKLKEEHGQRNHHRRKEEAERRARQAAEEADREMQKI